MFFEQLSDPESSTWTYLLGDPESREALLIDPVLEQVDTYISLLETLKLNLAYTLETHVHADHVTAGGELRERLGSNQSRAIGPRSHAPIFKSATMIRFESVESGWRSSRPQDTPTAACLT